MDSADLEVLRTAREWLVEGRRVWMVTVARTWGSSPRPPGSLLAIRDDVQFVGSVSGGCVEDDLAGRLAAGVLPVTLPRVETYGITRERTYRFGLPCGGSLDLVIEALHDAAALDPLVKSIEERQLIVRTLDLTTGAAVLEPAVRARPFEFDGARLVKTFGPAWNLLLIGAGQVARFVAEIALALDYRVIVCDPREEYAASWRVAGVDLDARAADEAVQEHAFDTRSAVVALAHDSEVDDLGLKQALMSRAFYVGALGSSANNAKRRQRLAALGVPDAALARLHGPVGLPLGGRTPAEIAVAIVAELTAARHGRRLCELSAIEERAESCPTSRAYC